MLIGTSPAAECENVYGAFRLHLRLASELPLIVKLVRPDVERLE
jgi:hypothetical protein